MQSLLFIDTNILLDFYRVRSREAGLSTLKHIDQHHARIITTSQVEMEFKKNRQRVILESHRAIKGTDGGGLSVPSILAETKQSIALKRTQENLNALSGTLKKRLGGVFKSPSSYDPVYKTAQRLFRDHMPTNLDRANKLRYEIRRLAWKRFILGYPPRKAGDTSIGDAVNWEWVVRCADETGCNVVIVTRDSDYGVTFDNKPVLNDWLRQEFKERVSRKRTVVLTDRLSEGLKAAQIKVSRAEEQNEEDLLRFIAEWRERLSSSIGTYTGDEDARTFLYHTWRTFSSPRVLRDAGPRDDVASTATEPEA